MNRQLLQLSFENGLQSTSMSTELADFYSDDDDDLSNNRAD